MNLSPRVQYHMILLTLSFGVRDMFWFGGGAEIDRSRIKPSILKLSIDISPFTDGILESWRPLILVVLSRLKQSVSKAFSNDHE